ncbi:MAG: M64 family metallopeptidase [Polyangiaceae bacterium]
MKARGLACAIALAAAAILAPARPAFAGACPAEAGDCSELATAGSTAASIDFVIVGDGYTAAERDKFFADAQTAADGILGSETYGAYKPVFNAWALFTPSQDSGADDPSAGVSVSTAFDASYDTNGIDYLLAVNDGKVHQEINKRFPEADLVLCIVNAKPYGGSGGSVAVVSLDGNSLEIARHEIGHTIAGLADEYTAPYPGFPDGDPEPNVASAAHLDPVKWSSWLTDGVAIPTPIADKKGDHDPVGAFEGARYKTTGVFRPTPNCLMRELNHTFCQVCAQAMVIGFSKLSLLIDAPSPALDAAIPGKGATSFSATIPALSDLMITWTIDGNPAVGTGGTLAVDPSALGLADGPHAIGLAVYDATALVRDDPDGVMKEAITWNITVDSNLPPIGGEGGAGGSTSTSSGGTGGTKNEGDCGCQTPGSSGAGASPWLAVAAAALAMRLGRRRPRR